MSVIKLSGAGTAGATVSYAIDIPLDGIITSVALGAAMTQNAALADNEFVRAEISFLSTPTFGVNDTRGSLCEAAAFIVGGGAAAAVIGVPSVPFCQLDAIDVKVNAGERVYLHVQCSATAVGSATGYLYIRDGADAVARAPRRR